MNVTNITNTVTIDKLAFSGENHASSGKTLGKRKSTEIALWQTRRAGEFRVAASNYNLGP